MPVTIHATERALFKIFCNDFVFSIPPYQRPYAWSKDKASELLTDLLAFLGTEKGSINDVNPYFLGSLVLIKTEETPEADVVDGQQRLTTLTILLSVLRTLVTTQYASEITTCIYERGSVIVGTNNRYRLTLREKDAAFFKKYIQDEDGVPALLELDGGQLTDSQQKIRENAEYFRSALTSLVESDRERLLQYVMTRCFLVVVSTPDFDSAYRIFSVLNTRGLDLELTDILKAEIIGSIPFSQQEKYTRIWVDEEEDLGREAFQELFAHIRMTYRKSKLRDSALIEFRKYVQPNKDPQKFIDNVLQPCSDSFETIRKASYQSEKGAESVNSLFRWLNQIDNFDWIPPAMVYLSGNKHQPERLKTFFTDLERLAASLMILRSDVNERIERYGRLLTFLENGADLNSGESPLQLTVDEKKRVIEALNGDLYLMKRIRQYVLLRLDSALSQGEAIYDYPVISVEHVLPQNPDKKSEWLKWFPDDTVRDKYVHRLGNLALLSRRKNAEAQNYDFNKKKDKYFATTKGVSPFVLTTQVLQKSEWTPSVVNNRQAELLDKLKGLWRL